MENKNTRIMLLTDNKTVNRSGGIEKVLCEFANEFVGRNYEVSLVCMELQKGVPFFELDKRVKFVNLAYDYSKKPLGGVKFLIKKAQKEILRTFGGAQMRFMGRDIPDPKQLYLQREFTERLANYLKINTPDIIITPGPESARIALDAQSLANIANIPVVPMDHQDPTTRRYSAQSLKTFGECKIAQALLEVFVPYFENMGVKRVVVIPNIVPQYDDSDIADLSHCHHRIIHVGRIDGAAKRQHLIIEAFAKLADKYPEWKVSLYGIVDNKTYKRKLDTMIKKYHLENRVVFEGVTNDVAAELKKSDIFFFPSAYEGFGLAMTEAMSIGLPVIVTECNLAAKGIIKSNDLGIVCRDEELADKLELMINDWELRVAMGKNAHNAMKEYAPKIVWDKWEALIEEVMADRA